MASTREGPGEGEVELVLAVCHEIGNLLGAVRLQAHLLGEEPSRRELAVTSVTLDDLCARAGSLLSQLRALLSDPSRLLVPVAPAAAISALRIALEEQGTRGVELQISVEPGLPEVRADFEVLHHMLLTQIVHAVEAVRPQGTIRVTARSEAPAVLFEIEDRDNDGESLRGWPEAPRRGRPLACAVAARILEGLGGTLSVTHENRITRVVFRLPCRPEEIRKPG